MNVDDDPRRDDGDDILAEVLEKIIAMHNRLGHELLAVQSVCAHLLAMQCGKATDPLAEVQQAAAMLSGTGVALADRRRDDPQCGNFDTRGATDAFERIGLLAEQNVMSSLRGSPRLRIV